MTNLDPNILIRLAIGLSLFAFGWTVFRLGINAAGFSMGFLFGFSFYEMLVALVQQINPDLNRFFPDHPLMPVIFGAVLGILGIILAKRLYIAAVFLSVLAGALYILYTDEKQREYVEQLFIWLNVMEPINQTLGQAWPAVLAILIAALFLLLQKQIIIVLSACAGSYIIADTINIPLLFLPLCFVGYILQQQQKKMKKKKVVVKEE